MAYSTINKPEDYFNTVLFTGNGGSSIAVTGVGFQPDWIWMKSRSDTEQHTAWDAVRGGSKRLMPDATSVEYDNSSQGIQSFDSDGFTGGQNDQYNKSSQTVVSWNWLGANGTSSNTDGSITSTVSANTTAGFSIVSYTGTGADASIGHGLGVAPKMLIVKNRDSAQEWTCYHAGIGATKYLDLNATTAATTFNLWQDTAPTSSVFTVVNHARVNGSGNNMIAYCFAEKKGYSKFGTFTGNGNADGTFVYTGFKPAWVVWKRTDSATFSDWVIMDNKRSSSNGENVLDKYLFADQSIAEGTATVQDHLSNGFKFRLSDGTTNTSGATYIYMAFAERSLVGTNGIPALAR